MCSAYGVSESASAPGKVILFGEHFVVYNSKAIVAAINRRCFARADFRGDANTRIISEAISYDGKSAIWSEKDLVNPLSKFYNTLLAESSLGAGPEIHIKSELPIGAGLGSSAAFCVAIAGVLRSILKRNAKKGISAADKKWVFEKALQGERSIHLKSSGVDCYVSTYGGLVDFAGLTKTKPIICQSLPLFLINTRIPHETSKLVSHVRRFSQNKAERFEELVNDATAICSSASKALAQGSQEELGRLMNENQKLLREIGVSNKEIEKIISVCKKCGSLGAKITGAGGGGSILVLASPQRVAALNSSIMNLGLRLEAIGIEKEGLVMD
jgi:mevalonate kinase